MSQILLKNSIGRVVFRFSRQELLTRNENLKWAAVLKQWKQFFLLSLLTFLGLGTTLSVTAVSMKKKSMRFYGPPLYALTGVIIMHLSVNITRNKSVVLNKHNDALLVNCDMACMEAKLIRMTRTWISLSDSSHNAKLHDSTRQRISYSDSTATNRFTISDSVCRKGRGFNFGLFKWQDQLK